MERVGSGGHSVLVERDAEMAALVDVLAQVGQGKGGVVILNAGPGVGRTALLDEFLCKAAESGARVCAATGSSAEQDVEYGIVGQLFPPNGGLSAGLRLARAIGRRDTGPDPDVDALFDMLCREFRQRPVVIGVDDAQFADAPSLRFLLHLVRRLRTTPVMIVLTEPTGPDSLPPSFQAEVLRQPQCRRLGLLPLSRAGVAHTIAMHVDEAEAEAETTRLAADFHAVSGGNPLLVQALLTDHRDAHRRDQEAAIGLPATGAAFAKASLAWAYRDDPVLFDVACGFAVLGESATPALVACLADRGADAVARVMTALDTAGLLDGGTLRSAVVGRALLEHVDVETRAELRRRAAGLLRVDGAPATAVARQLLAAPVAEPWAGRTLLAAADKAMRDGQTEFSLDCLRLAGRNATTEHEHAAVVMARVRIGWEIDPRLVSPWLDELVGALEQGSLRSADAAWIVKHLAWQDRFPQAAECLRALTERAGPDAPGATAELHAVRHWLRHSCPPLDADAPDAPDLGAPRTAQPRQVSPASYAAEVLGQVLTEGPGEYTIGMAEEILRGCRYGEAAVEDLEAALLALLYADRPDRAVFWCDLLLNQAGDRSTGTSVAILSGVRAEIALRHGALHAAEQHASSALSAISRSGWGVAIGSPLAALVQAATASGMSGAAGAWLNQDVPEGMFQTRHGLLYTHARGHYHLAVDRPAAALDDFLTCGDLAKQWGMDVPTFLPWRTSAAQAHLALGNPGQARTLVREQLARPGGSTPRARGVSLRLLAATSELGQRPALLRESVSLLENASDPVELLRSLADRCQVLHEVGAPAKARMTARHARTVADSCGGHTLFRKLFKDEEPENTAEADGLTGEDQGSASLTAAERRVIALAALGHSNREIGRKLFITKSTVEQHLTRAYRKLGVRNRTDLGDLLAGTNLAAGASAL
ncbi:helix-turn-helix transcriptional regulator [Streptomyces sp. HD]|uniref:helix-turn-helix transcriptional regulator n=1 Tax=Streptomyces sp. HD TaxID=3020892 RepID=UPI00232C78E9|nr:LuxR family transcriptional regulator [Streptomyces sp. HD]MDC0768177.1 LuxR C-terminal-related transcriptional regulator [Streptomyces sp. HD]